MKPRHYFVVLLISVACVLLSAALILMGHTNQKMQVALQNRQQALNQGILGQQAQQISGGVMQDLAGAAAGNSEIRQLLEKYGYSVPKSMPPAAALSSPGNKPEETTNPETPKP